MNTKSRLRIFRVILGLLAGIIITAGCASVGATEPAPAATDPSTAIVTQPPQPAASPTAQQPAGTEPAAPAPTRTFVLVGTPQEEIMPTPITSPLPQDPYLAGLVDQAIKDLASRLKTPVGQIEFIRFEPVVWPDSSMGCPQPDMAYTQVMVEGYRIELQSGGSVYNYHGGGNRTPFLCEDGTK